MAALLLLSSVSFHAPHGVSQAIVVGRTAAPAMSLLAGLRGRFRAKREVEELSPQIAVGTKLPEVDVELCNAEDKCEIVTLMEALTSDGINGTSILVGMPGGASACRI
mmetsp:Transcript_643/g.1751  ORF Transcript_643/g.1751 Transcript_643/m.1751 type:complete len:108 (+) Transcript_643:20-343(+)